MNVVIVPPTKKGISMGNTINIKEQVLEYIEYDIRGNRTQKHIEELICYQMSENSICDYDICNSSNKFKHICKFSGKNRCIPDFFADQQSKAIEFDDFMMPLCCFLSRYNISCKSICSDLFYRLTMQVISTSRKENKNIPNDSIVNFPTEKDISKYNIEKGIYLLFNKIKNHGHRFCSITIDAGTITHHNIVVVNIINPNDKPVFFMIHYTQGSMT